MSTSDPAAENWHFDKRIPLALIVTMMVQFGGGIWWMSSIQERVNRHEEDIRALEASADESIRDSNSLGNRITRIEEKLTGQTLLLEDIRNLLKAPR
jgi:hypothetical protein